MRPGGQRQQAAVSALGQAASGSGGEALSAQRPTQSRGQPTFRLSCELPAATELPVDRAGDESGSTGRDGPLGPGPVWAMAPRPPDRARGGISWKLESWRGDRGSAGGWSIVNGKPYAVNRKDLPEREEGGWRLEVGGWRLEDGSPETTRALTTGLVGLI